MKIEIKNYSKKLNDTYVIKDLNLMLNSGNVYGIVGKNGSGKSVLLKSICGLTNIEEGQILIDNEVLGKSIEFIPNVGAILDGAGFIPHLSGFSNLKLLASIKNKVADEDIKKAMSILQLDYNDKKPYKKYSLGMKQKLAIAQAIMEKPQVLILDEPFNGIDNESVEKIKEILKEYKDNGALIVITSHIEDEIKSICNVVYEISEGKISNYKFENIRGESCYDKN